MLAAYLSLLAFCNPVGLHMNYIRVTNTLQKWWIIIFLIWSIVIELHLTSMKEYIDFGEASDEK